MIDTKELRAVIQEIGLNGVCPAEINELIDRLEAAEAEALEEARLNGMGSEREAALMAKLEAAERERDECNRRRLEAADHFAAQTALMKQKYDDLRVKVAEMERQEPVGVLHVGNYYGEELQDWEFEANQCACDKLNEVYVSNPTSLPLYAIPGAQNIPEKLCYDSRWEISIDYVDGWNAAVDMMRGKSPSWHCPDCCIAFPFGAPKSCPNDDARCNSLLAAAPEAKP